MTVKSPKIAVFGSAFNPPSLGHLSVISRLQHFDKVLLVPSIAHAWGKQMLEFEHRCELVRRFVDDISLKNVQISTIEAQIYDGSHPVTTYQLLSSIQESNLDADITFVVGPDNFFNFSKFSRADEVVSKWSVLACPETVGIRSTQIRQNLVDGQPIDHLTTVSVRNYLIEKKFYYRIESG
ncbi:nicotinate-nicotinamide nucleotide adenylyltransferase [Vibrio ulleungensis]|uniref:nicotinate-nucleotide adenylyltransferase n=1 Tax=Vibrio ulleungensis TaxID=2807619 RepID=A0ABS2HHG1_9VIBR|nr:nicotinate-nicotinamide nucleotide adenylyltransferase [Vibrio ulleungensis]MBM7036973.1 nicotinate-nicotinamide nucleotide adenylyltransferase [Vibrio ulleungensis]